MTRNLVLFKHTYDGTLVDFGLQCEFRGLMQGKEKNLLGQAQELSCFRAILP